MKPPVLGDRERQHCAVLAAALASGQATLGALGLGAAAVAALALVAALPGAALSGLALLFAPLERVLALRVRLDAALFRGLARPAATLAGLDDALHHLGLRRAADTLRPLDDRIRGAWRLGLQHAAVVLVQFIAVAVVLLRAGAEHAG